MKKLSIVLLLSLLSSSSYALSCVGFSALQKWHGTLRAATATQKNIAIKVTALQQSNTWRAMTLNYKVKGKSNVLHLQGDCYTDAKGVVSIKAINTLSPSTAVLFIVYHKTSGKLRIGTGMLPLDASEADVKQTMGSVSGYLRPNKIP